MKQATYLLFAALLALLVYIGVSSSRLITQSKLIQQKEEHYAQITKIDYGLFNLRSWKDKALSIFTKRLNEFEISSGAYGQVERELRSYLYGIYKDYFVSGKLFDQLFKEAEEKKSIPPVLLNMFKKNLPEQIKNLNIEANIPSMAKMLAKEMQKKEPAIKAVLKSELDKILVDADTTIVIDPRDELLTSYVVNDFDSLKTKLVVDLEADKSSFKGKVNFMLLLFAIALLIISVIYFLSKNMPLTIGSLSLTSILLLVLGISLPMIVLDVRLNAFEFLLFGQPLAFEEQTMFFQSKSILDVTQNLLEGRTIDLKIVGIMVLCFSVIFPVIKLILSGIYLAIPKLQNSALVKGLIFHLGKWSMADVFVVALFMAYVGLYGLINTQLEKLEQNKSGFAVETVNYTHLEYGALFFTTYCILSIVLGVILSRSSNRTNAT
jgi:hypothetical protein